MRKLIANLDSILFGLMERIRWRWGLLIRPPPTPAERKERFDTLNSIRTKILSRSHSDMVEGAGAGATELQRSFLRHLEAESKRLKTAGSAAMMHNAPEGLESHISGWAAHFMTVSDFEEFYVETILANRQRGPEALMSAWRAVAHFRDFPRLVAAQTRCLSETYLGGIEDEATREAHLNRSRESILPFIELDLEKGRDTARKFELGEIGEYHNQKHRLYYTFVQAETDRLNKDESDTVAPAAYLQEVKLHGWAAHFAFTVENAPAEEIKKGYDEYKKLFARTIIANRVHEVLAARRALHAARFVAGFPPYESQFDVCAQPRAF